MADVIGLIILIAVALFIIRLFAGGPESPSRPQRAAPHRPPGRHPVAQARVDQVAALFPNIRVDDIREDLARTGSVDATIENILSGRLVDSSSSKSAAPPPSKLASLLEVEPLETPPPNKWESSPEARANNLKQRKAFMLQEARRKFMEKNGQPAAPDAPSAATGAAS
ncbi:hypothetical protein DFJ74DRAFT_713417 [Hyaloraphidium curvatum]|nr:hypothetical protein DFJ74DRAFT_713417 [Hyaloraphidium curvatum]